MNTATITIEIDEAGATQAFRRVNAEAGKLGPTFQPIQRISEQTFNNIEGGALRAREAAALMGEEFGVHVPRALRGVLAESTAIGPALSAAFSGLALIGFIDIAKNAGEAVAKFVDELAGWSEFAKSTMDAQSALNKEIVDSIDNIKKLDKAYRLIGLEGVAKFAEQQKISNEELDAAKKKVADLTAEMRRLQALSKEMRTVTTADIPGQPGTGGKVSAESTAAAAKAQQDLVGVITALGRAQYLLRGLGVETRNVGKEFDVAVDKKGVEALTKLRQEAESALKTMQAMRSEAAKAGATPEGAVDAELVIKRDALLEIIRLHQKEPIVVGEAERTIIAITKSASAQRIKILEAEVDKRFKAEDDSKQQQDRDAHELLEKSRRMEDEVLSIERSAAIAAAPPWERANVSILASYQERMDKIREMLKTEGDVYEPYAARQATAAWNVAFAQTRDNMANQMETLFNDITSGNIGKAFLDMFKKMVFQMVATWILGMRGMRSAAAGAMGGGSGSVLDTLFRSFGINFGGSGGAGAGAMGGGGLMGLDNLPLFSGGAGADFASGSMLGLGISAGQGAGVPGVVLPSGSGPASALGGIGGFLSKLLGGSGNPAALAFMLPLALLTSGNSSAKHVGAFMLGGPIGLILSFLFGGEHKGDKARREIMEPLIAQIKVVRDSYDVFQTDYNTGIGELEKLRSDAITGLRKIGGRQVSGNTAGTNKLVDTAEAYLKTTEAERARRGQIAFGPPQFREGGFVHPSLASGMPSYFRSNALAFATGGEVPAILHSGEFVMNQSAVSRVGRDSLDRMNAGGGAGNHFTFNINAIDAKSFEEFLRQHRTMDSFARMFRRGALEGHW